MRINILQRRERGGLRRGRREGPGTHGPTHLGRGFKATHPDEQIDRIHMFYAARSFTSAEVAVLAQWAQQK